MAEAKAQGWGNIASARPEGVGARASLTDVAGEEDASMQALLDVILGKSGGGGGVPRAQARQGGLQAARILEQAGRRGQQMYTQLAGCKNLGAGWSPWAADVHPAG